MDILLLNIQFRFVVDHRSDTDFHGISVPIQAADDTVVFQRQTLLYRVIPPWNCHDRGCALIEMQLRVKARDIAIVEEETPRAPAWLLEAALSFLLQGLAPAIQKQSEVSVSVQRIRELRPALIPA